MRAVAQRGECTVLMITHKFREVMAFADEVTVLRRGRKVHGAAVATTTPAELAAGDDRRVGDAARRRGRSTKATRSRASRPMPRRRSRSRSRACVAMGDRGALAVARPQPRGASAARSSASPASPATASASWSRRSSASAARRRHGHASIGAAVRRPTRARTAPQGCARCPRSRCATPAWRAERGREHGAARLRRGAAAPPVAAGLAWLRFAAWRARAREWIAALRRQDARRERADRAASPAATCSARCWRASSPATSTC